MKKGSDTSNRILLDYITVREKLTVFLSESGNEVMVLSTSAHNLVMSRNVLIVNDDLDLYFFTRADSRKCVQIDANKRVSLCRDKVEIEGTARCLGPMRAKHNESVLELFAARIPDAITYWETKPNMVFYLITPSFAVTDGYNEAEDVFIEYLDLEKKIAYKEKWLYP